MKIYSSIAIIGVLLAANPLFAADAKDDVTAAAKKLGASANYTWTSTSQDGQFRPHSEGKTEKNGFTTLTLTFGENGSSQVVLKDGKGALKFDADWVSLGDAAKDDGGGGFNPTRFIAMRMQNFKSPAMDAESLVSKSAELKMTDGVYEGALTTDGAKDVMMMGRPGSGATVTNATGSVKFWVTDGVLSKYQFKVAGHVEFNGNERDVDRTTTIEIKDVGTTKVEVADDAKKKIG